MKIAIISSCSLPVPAVNGGAVESLIESIIKENETNKCLDIFVYALYSQEAEKSSKAYPHTTFKYLTKSSLISNVDKAITKLLRIAKYNSNVASRNYIWKINVISSLKKELKKESYDKIVIENTVFLFDIFKDKELFQKYQKKVYFHVHNSLVKRTKVDYKNLISKIISISDFLHDNIKDHFDKDIEIITVHNGIDCKKFSSQLSVKEKSSIKKDYGIPEDNDIVIFVGRITPEKGIRETILAFNKLNRENCNLVIVGASYFGSGAISPFECEISQLITKNPKIQTIGYVSKDDVWKFYAIGSVIVLPSMWEEPLGLTMIEAQAAAIPLITTQSGGIPETVDNQYSILLDKNGDVIENIKISLEKILGNKLEWKRKAIDAQTVVNREFKESVFYKKFVEELQK